jgi:glycosyltransferase EpsF
MRVLRVLNSLNCGGIETVMLKSMPHLQRKGVRADICVCKRNGALENSFLKLGCRIVQIEKTASVRVAARRFQKLLRQGKYDVVHSHFEFTSGAFAQAARELRIPIAVSIHNVEQAVLTSWSRLPLLRTVRSALLRNHRSLMEENVDVFVGHSLSNLNHFQADWRNSPARYRVIMNGIQFPERVPPRVEARRLLGIGSHERVILHVGSFREQKNHDGLVQIIREVSRNLADVRVVLIGTGHARPRIERKLHAMGLERNVLFAGQQIDIWPYFAAADVFLFPSLFEGFGNVLVEAQAANLPIVASDIPPHREAVAPEQHRFLFELPQYDTAANLVLTQLESASAGTNFWTSQSYEFVRQRFSIERHADDIYRLYQDLGGLLGQSNRVAAQCEMPADNRLEAIQGA